MRIKIRKGVFETNSSSMHSLVVKKENEYYTQEEMTGRMYLDDNGVWKIWSDDDLHFGREPFQCLGDFSKKVKYAIASLCGYNDNAKETFDNIVKLVHEICPACTDIVLPTEYSYEDDSNTTYYGYVEEDILSDFLAKENITLKEFLSNKKYIVIVDGDEHCIYKSMKRSGMINTDNIEKEYSNYPDYGTMCGIL